MRCLLISVFAFMISLPVAGQDYAKALEAYQNGDHATALQQWTVFMPVHVTQSTSNEPAADVTSFMIDHRRDEREGEPPFPGGSQKS